MNKKTVIAIIAFVLVIGAVAALYFIFVPKATEGVKNITIEVIDDKGEAKNYSIKTEAKYIADAMTDAGITYEDDNGYVNTVNGITADYGKDKSYWWFSINGKNCDLGIYEQPIKDGDSIKIEYLIKNEE